MFKKCHGIHGGTISMIVKPKFVISGLYLLVLVLWLPVLGYSGENQSSACNEEWCFLVAQPPSEWPSQKAKNTFPLEEKTRISLQIPKGFEKIYRVSNLFIFSYENKKSTITFEEISRETVPELPKDTCMSVKDVGHAIFTKTPKDPDPGCPNLWHWAMLSKSMYFRKGVPVFTAKKSNLTVYYLTSKDKFDPSKTGNLAVVVNEKRPESFLVIRTVGFSFNQFKNIIGSIIEITRGG
jgi:hypothetical protein